MKIKKPKLKVKRPKSLMFIKYLIRLFCRGAILLIILYLYIFQREFLRSFVEQSFFGLGFNFKHILWIILMCGMLAHLLPKTRITMSGRKIRRETYVPPTSPYDAFELYKFISDANIKAWKVMLSWLCFNSIFAVLYLLGVIGNAELLLLSFAYFVFDLVCMLCFCPFQSLIMKNRCCVNCRIFDWGHFMIYTPMLLIKSFYSWSLFFMACIVLIRWEVVYASHPERFWSESNTALQCANCKDKMCQIKQPLADAYKTIKTHIER